MKELLILLSVAVITVEIMGVAYNIVKMIETERERKLELRRIKKIHSEKSRCIYRRELLEVLKNAVQQ